MSARKGLIATFGQSLRRIVATACNASRPSFKRQHFVEVLEPRQMLHAGVDHGINGPHESDPGYDLNRFHIHANLSIFVNGKKTPIPTFGGAAGGDDIHTHDPTGLIHIHPQTPRTSYVRLGEVFERWRLAPQNGNPLAFLSENNLLNNIEDATHTVYLLINGVLTDSYQNYQIHDGDDIVLAYSANPIVTINTNLGRLPFELFADKTPITVNNFLNYVNEGDYSDSFFHRFVPGFVLQGGGFKTSTTSFADPSVVHSFSSVTTDSAIQNEFDNFAKQTGTQATVIPGNPVIQLGSNVDLSDIVAGDRIRLAGQFSGINNSNMFNIVAVNDAEDTVTVQSAPSGNTSNSVQWTIFPRVNVTGTIAMAKLGNSPNSATSQFFINLVNNDANLDIQNSGFTVFGQLLDHSILADIGALNDLSIFSANLTGAQEVPPVTTNASGTATLALNNANLQFDLKLDVQGLTAADITASHIHAGGIGVEGASFFNLGDGAEYIAAGSKLQRTVDNGVFPASHLNGLFAHQTYVNVHTTAHSDGEIRGQLTSVRGGLYSDLPTTSGDQLVVIESFSGEGVVQGTVFYDADQDGARDQDEFGLHTISVYSDANGNQQLDSGEEFTRTNRDGSYKLQLPAGQHQIRVLIDDLHTQTLPDDSYEVVVQIGRQITGRDFGLFAEAREWRNPRNHRDVNNDGRLSPIDALIVINEINDPQHSTSNAELGQRTSNDKPYYDVNGDNFVTLLDALNIINYFNQGGGESESDLVERSISSDAAEPAVEGLLSDLPLFDTFLLDHDDDEGAVEQHDREAEIWDNVLSMIAHDRSELQG